MTKKYIGITLCLLLAGCTPNNIEVKNTVTTPDTYTQNESTSKASEAVKAQEIVDDETTIKEKNSDINLNSYSGDWSYWNNPNKESDGGIALNLTIYKQNLKANISAWSPNYNRLADAELSGDFQGNSGEFHYDDDGRGHAGTVYLTLENNIIQMEVITDETSINGDFTFPNKKIILQRTKPQGNTPDKDLSFIDSDSSFPLTIYSDVETADYRVSYNDAYETIKKWIDEGEHGTWEEYTNYTVLNKKEVWPAIKNADDYVEFSSVMQTLIEPNEQHTLTFIEEENSKLLCSAFSGSHHVTSERGIQCGDSIEDIETAYGKKYINYNTDKYIICEYKTLIGYLRFFLDSQTNIITQWGIDKYSYEDRIKAPYE